MVHNKRLKCWQCHGPLQLKGDEENVFCKYCGATQDLQAFSETEQELIEQAAKLRNEEHFEDAEKIYDRLLKDNKKNYLARWERLLCKYGVVYVEKDDGSGEHLPTCRLIQDSEILNEKDLEIVLNEATLSQSEKFGKEAKYISDIQRKIKEASTAKYDVFICYKESDGRGGRTLDSDRAETIYVTLKQAGYRVFFARQTLLNMAGADYEAAIFNAIRSAKVMLVVSSKREYINSKWVRSEWTRFLSAKKDNPSKVLIPVVRDMSLSIDLPEEIISLHAQAIDMAKDQLDGYALLKSNIESILGTKEGKITDSYSPKKLKSEEVDKGHDFYVNDDYEKAMECYREAAKTGNPDAYYFLGSMYYSIDEINDSREAFRCFSRAANMGNVQAMYRLGTMYELGEGVSLDINQAKIWYSKARQAGCEWIPELD